MSTNTIAIGGLQLEDRPWVDVLHGWLTTVDHKRLGILYFLSSLLFLTLGGAEALVIRIQLMHSHNNLFHLKSSIVCSRCMGQP
jgi:cytochrome c oxidase subunit 1